MFNPIFQDWQRQYRTDENIEGKNLFFQVLGIIETINLIALMRSDLELVADIIIMFPMGFFGRHGSHQIIEGDDFE